MTRKNRASYSFDPETENWLVNEAGRTRADVTQVVASLVAKERKRRFEAQKGKDVNDLFALSSGGKEYV